MANSTKLKKAAAPILKVLLQTWCSAVRHSSGESIEKISEKLDIKDGKFSHWKSDKIQNIPSFKELEEAASHALANKWIPEELNQSILDSYEDFSENPNEDSYKNHRPRADGRVDHWNLIRVVNRYKEFMLNAGEPQPLIDQFNVLGKFVHGPDESSPEFSEWINQYKLFFLALDDQNLNEYVNIKTAMEFADSKEEYGYKRPDEIPTDNELKKKD